VWLEIEGGSKNLSNPFKFNATWLSDDEFRKIVKDNWVGYDLGTSLSAVVHFVANLKPIKQLVIPWALAKRASEERELRKIEAHLDCISHSADGGFISMEAKVDLKALETHRRKLLNDQEVEWCLKSRAI